MSVAKKCKVIVFRANLLRWCLSFIIFEHVVLLLYVKRDACFLWCDVLVDFIYFGSTAGMFANKHKTSTARQFRFGVDALVGFASLEWSTRCGFLMIHYHQSLQRVVYLNSIFKWIMRCLTIYWDIIFARAEANKTCAESEWRETWRPVFVWFAAQSKSICPGLF